MTSVPTEVRTDSLERESVSPQVNAETTPQSTQTEVTPEALAEHRIPQLDVQSEEIEEQISKRYDALTEGTDTLLHEYGTGEEAAEQQSSSTKSAESLAQAALKFVSAHPELATKKEGEKLAEGISSVVSQLTQVKIEAAVAEGIDFSDIDAVNNFFGTDLTEEELSDPSKFGEKLCQTVKTEVVVELASVAPILNGMNESQIQELQEALKEETSQETRLAQNNERSQEFKAALKSLKAYMKYMGSAVDFVDIPALIKSFFASESSVGVGMFSGGDYHFPETESKEQSQVFDEVMAEEKSSEVFARVLLFETKVPSEETEDNGKRKTRLDQFVDIFKPENTPERILDGRKRWKIALEESLQILGKKLPLEMSDPKNIVINKEMINKLREKISETPEKKKAA